MWEIWANELLPKALKSFPKSNKSPNLVTLVVINSINLTRSLRKGEQLFATNLFPSHFRPFNVFQLEGFEPWIPGWRTYQLYHNRPIDDIYHTSTYRQ